MTLPTERLAFLTRILKVKGFCCQQDSLTCDQAALWGTGKLSVISTALPSPHQKCSSLFKSKRRPSGGYKNRRHESDEGNEDHRFIRKYQELWGTLRTSPSMFVQHCAPDVWASRLIHPSSVPMVRVAPGGRRTYASRICQRSMCWMGRSHDRCTLLNPTSIFQIPSWGSWSHFLEGNTHVKVVKGTSTVMAGEVVTQQWNSSWAFSTVTGCTRQLRGCSILLFCTLDLGQLNPKSLPSTDPYLTEVPTQCWSTLGECFCPSCLEDPTVPQAVNSARFPVICPS